jgi:hypothetical protein
MVRLKIADAFTEGRGDAHGCAARAALQGRFIRPSPMEPGANAEGIAKRRVSCREPGSQSAGGQFQNAAHGTGLPAGGLRGITLPLDVAQQFITSPAVDAAIVKFEQDWQGAFGRTSI